ncbi:zinc-binding alcohol dehydrogenase family protein [Pelagibacterium nitratireducens]|uniref:Zinc-binding alcohol dehydrogenase family protein n=1 Tax=Pelagibacterium nitratireducens TaxID=1046114 RepID=A0ABZ2I0W7_9HYPH
MKAAIYDRSGPPEVFRYADVADPQIGPRDVLIEVSAISIEGGDVINRRLAEPPASNHIVGYAAAGTVIALGSDVTNRKVGDRVTGFDLAGSHAALRAVAEEQTWLVPDGVGWDEAAAMLISFGTAHHALFASAALQKGEHVVIWAAAGGVGLAAVQLAKRAGARVLAVASGEERLQRLKAIGADHVVDYRKDDVGAFVRSHTQEKGANVIVDPVGSTLPDSLAVLAQEGRLVFVGNAGGGALSVDLWTALAANQTLYGVYMGTQFTKPSVSATIDEMLRDIAKGTLKVHIDRIFPLSEAGAAHQHAETGSPFGRVVMHP